MPDVPGEVFTSAKDHPALAVAPALEGLGWDGAVALDAAWDVGVVVVVVPVARGGGRVRISGVGIGVGVGGGRGWVVRTLALGCGGF